MTYLPGQSGNPKGRPPGSGKRKVLADALESRKMDILERCVQIALDDLHDGQTVMLRALLDRLIPTLRPVAAEGLNQPQQPNVVIYLPRQDELRLDD